MLNLVWLFVTPWIVALQAPLSMGFSGQEYWSRLPFPPLGDLPHSETEPTSPVSPALQADSLLLSNQESPNVMSKLDNREFRKYCGSELYLVTISLDLFLSSSHLSDNKQEGVNKKTSIFYILLYQLLWFAFTQNIYNSLFIFLDYVKCCRSHVLQ